MLGMAGYFRRFPDNPQKATALRLIGSFRFALATSWAPDLIPEGGDYHDFETGEAYYVGPGHTGEVAQAGTRVVEFSPSDEYAQTMAVVAKNLGETGA